MKFEKEFKNKFKKIEWFSYVNNINNFPKIINQWIRLFPILQDVIFANHLFQISRLNKMETRFKIKQSNYNRFKISTNSSNWKKKIELYKKRFLN